jgi:hypothetical protein
MFLLTKVFLLLEIVLNTLKLIKKLLMSFECVWPQSVPSTVLNHPSYLMSQILG